MIVKEQALKTLEDKLVNSSSFAEINEYFFNHFAESNDWDSGELTEKPLLKKLIVRLASSKFAVGSDYSYLSLYDKTHAMFHGCLRFKDHTGVFFYLPSVDKGLLSVSSFKGKVDFFRFSLSILGENNPTSTEIFDLEADKTQEISTASTNTTKH